MKKIFLLLLPLAFIFTACAKETIPAEDGATLFINRLVYDKDSESFEENFSDSKALKEVMDKNAADFKENFKKGLMSTSTVTDEQADTFYNALYSQMQDKTSYTVEVKAENDETAQVTYHITGLDYPALIKKTDEDLLAAIKGDNSIAKDDNKIMATTLSALEKNVQDVSLNEEVTDITLVFTKNKGQWSVTQDQSKKVTDLYLAFVTGAKDQATLNEQLTQVGDEVNAALEAELGK